jgi:hypothetical protein
MSGTISGRWADIIRGLRPLQAAYRLLCCLLGPTCGPSFDHVTVQFLSEMVAHFGSQYVREEFEVRVRP